MKNSAVSVVLVTSLTVNLAAKAFLFGKDPEAYETNSYSLPEQEEKDLNN
jgi:hypothetical protein